MPPVFGPVSPSPIRLKSCAAPSDMTLARPRPRERDLLPSSSSSTTMGPRTAGRAQPLVELLRGAATKTPFRRRARRLHDARCPRDGELLRAGTLAACRPPAENFDPSIRVVAALGPKTAIPLRRMFVADARDERRFRPDHDEIRVQRQLADTSSKPSPSSARTGWQAPSLAIPGLPGAAWSSPSDGLRARRHASACSSRA